MQLLPSFSIDPIVAARGCGGDGGGGCYMKVVEVERVPTKRSRRERRLQTPGRLLCKHLTLIVSSKQLYESLPVVLSMSVILPSEQDSSLKAKQLS